VDGDLKGKALRIRAFHAQWNGELDPVGPASVSSAHMGCTFPGRVMSVPLIILRFRQDINTLAQLE
jgi:hypothetical protein